MHVISNEHKWRAYVGLYRRRSQCTCSESDAIYRLISASTGIFSELIFMTSKLQKRNGTCSDVTNWQHDHECLISVWKVFRLNLEPFWSSLRPFDDLQWRTVAFAPLGGLKKNDATDRFTSSDFIDLCIFSNVFSFSSHHSVVIQLFLMACKLRYV